VDGEENAGGNVRGSVQLLNHTEVAAGCGGSTPNKNRSNFWILLKLNDI
jgi:hypothetical protein